jgi:hypothetical protein
MKFALSSLSISFLTAAATCAAPPTYQVHDLAVPVETFPYAIDMNDYGQIAGSTFGGAPFLWTPTTPGGVVGTYTPLETPFGISHFVGGINELGQIAGSTNTGSTSVALLWQPATPNGAPGTPIPLFPAFGFPNGINESGQVAGNAIVGGVGAAFLFKPQTLNGSTGTVINPFGGGKGSIVNDHGQVAGVTGAGVVLWQPTAPNAMTGSAAPIGVSSNENTPIKINSSGQIAGGDESTGPFLWRPSTPNGIAGTATPIARFPNLEIVEVNDLNDAGVVLGTSYGGNPFSFRPWIWSVEDGLIDINQLLLPADVAAGWTIERSGAINNNGYIVALATLTEPGSAPVARTVLLAPIPEPTAGALLLAGITATLMRRQMRSRPTNCGT